MVFRVAIIVTEELDLDQLSRALSLVWLAVCAYTWFALVMFRRMVARSLEAVRHDPEL